MPKGDENWDENRALVLHELARLAESHEKLIHAITQYEINNLEAHSKIHAEIAALKVKSGAWGAIAGAVMACMILLAGFIGSRSSKPEEKKGSNNGQTEKVQPDTRRSR